MMTLDRMLIMQNLILETQKEILKILTPKKKKKVARKNCKECSGTGWVPMASGDSHKCTSCHYRIKADEQCDHCNGTGIATTNTITDKGVTDEKLDN